MINSLSNKIPESIENSDRKSRTPLPNWISSKKLLLPLKVIGYSTHHCQLFFLLGNRASGVSFDTPFVKRWIYLFSRIPQKKKKVLRIQNNIHFEIHNEYWFSYLITPSVMNYIIFFSFSVQTRLEA